MITHVEVFCNQCDMQVNVTKTQWMIFEGKKKKTQRRRRTFSLNLLGRNLARVHNFKYLGVFFSGNMSFTDPVKYVLIKAEKAAFLY